MKNTVFYGDTVEKMKLIPDNSVDLICADLPYGKTKNKDMKPEHRQILNKIEEYLKQPGAEHLRFWQALYGMGVIKGEMKIKQAFHFEMPELITEIIDDFNISDEVLLKRIK